MSHDGHLTPAEIRIVRLFSEGKEWKEVMAECTISRATLKNHLSSIRSKLGALNKAHAVAIAKDKGII